jgi:hypothetical protein
LRLGVHGHEHEKRTGSKGMIHGVESLPEGGRDGSGRMQGVGFSHGRKQAVKIPLPLSGNLLHVGAFVFGGFVSQQKPDPQTVAGRSQGTGQRVHGARSDGCYHGGLFVLNPPQSGRGMYGFGFVPDGKSFHHAGGFVHPEDLSKIG